MPTPARTTRERILDAGIEAASIHGLGRLTVADVARRAEVSRVTLYKHFDSKDALLGAAVAREVEVMVAAATAAADGEDDARGALEAAIGAVLFLAREHPLLDRIVRTEPEALLPLLVADESPATLIVRSAVERILLTRFALADLALRRLADMVARLVISYAVNAPDDPPDVVAAAVATVLVEGANALRTQPIPQEQR